MPITKRVRVESASFRERHYVSVAVASPRTPAEDKLARASVCDTLFAFVESVITNYFNAESVIFSFRVAHLMQSLMLH